MVLGLILLVTTSKWQCTLNRIGQLQASQTENTVDYAQVLKAMKRVNYSGFVVLEYVWVDWMGCNEVDNISETIMLRDLLRSAAAENG